MISADDADANLIQAKRRLFQSATINAHASARANDLVPNDVPMLVQEIERQKSECPTRGLTYRPASPFA
jgi:hypothetical protein